MRAAGGMEALRLLGEEKVGAVLLDLNMGELDGYDVLRNIRGNPRLANLTVLMLSADGGQETVARCWALGADDCLVKPYHSGDPHVRLAVALDVRRAKQGATLKP